MSLDESRVEIVRRVNAKICSIDDTLELLGEFWPSRGDDENEFYFKQVERYLKKQKEYLQLNGEY